MTSENDRLLSQFYRGVADKDAKTPEAVRAVLDEMGEGAGEKIATSIIYYCEQNRIDPKHPAIIQYYRETAAWKQEQREEEAKVQADKGAAALSNTLNDFIARRNSGASPTLPEMSETVDRIVKEAAEIKTAIGEPVFLSFGEYRHRRANYKKWEQFSPRIFHELPFPDGSVNLIGAPSGGGKTAALTNLAREILLTEKPKTTNTPADRAKEKDSRRRVIFVSREMLAEDIIDRLIMNMAWSLHKDEKLKDITEPDGTVKKALENAPDYEIHGVLRLMERKDASYSQHQYLFYEVITKYIQPAMETGRFIIHNAIFSDWVEEIINAVKSKVDKGDVVLIDYAQLLPPSNSKDAQTYGTADYLRVRYITKALREFAADTGAVVICAAQINRQAANDMVAGKEPTETAFKDSSDLEQAAHSAVIMGWRKEEKDGEEISRISYICVKARSSHHRNDKFYIDWRPDYQYMGPGEKVQTKGKKTPKAALAGADVDLIMLDMVKGKK
jgi:hypothetical protein